MVPLVTDIITPIDTGGIIIGVTIRVDGIGCRLIRRSGIPGITTGEDTGFPANGW
jgi:hypothetical protein